MEPKLDPPEPEPLPTVDEWGLPVMPPMPVLATDPEVGWSTTEDGDW